MNDLQRLVQVANIAKGLAEPGRQEEAFRYHKVLIETLNDTHKGGEQDALAVFEGIAHVIAQLIANLEVDGRAGICTYIAMRAGILAPIYAEEGMGAQMKTEKQGTVQ